MGDLPGHGQWSSPALRVAPWPMALSFEITIVSQKYQELSVKVEIDE
jgi:hypothetical protein